MSRPIQRGDIVRHPGRAVRGRVRDTWDLHGEAFIAVDVRSTGSTWACPASEWEFYDEDALARPIRRFLAGIAMAAAMRQAAISLAVSMTSAQARVMADWVGKVSPPVDHHWGHK